MRIGDVGDSSVVVVNLYMISYRMLMMRIEVWERDNEDSKIELIVVTSRRSSITCQVSRRAECHASHLICQDCRGLTKGLRRSACVYARKNLPVLRPLWYPLLVSTNPHPGVVHLPRVMKHGQGTSSFDASVSLPVQSFDKLSIAK